MNDDELPTYRYTDLDDNPGVAKLVEDMKRLREEYDAESVSVSVWVDGELLPPGMMKVSLDGDLLSLEGESGWTMIVNANP